jgi:alanine dehydrogenase
VHTVDGILHYGVTNMPGAVPRTSTYALSNATLPYLMKMAEAGVLKAVQEDLSLARGVNVYDGKITYKAVADAFDLEHTPLDSLI